MTEEILDGVSPTRMDLLEIRKKLILAEKGHKLLEEKRDALVEKFFNIIDKRNQMLKDLNLEFKEAFLSLIEAQMILGEDKVDEASYLVESVGEITFENDNIMGVKIPKIDSKEIKNNLKPFYGFFETCSKLDDAQKMFNALLSKLISLANLEAGIKSLAIEIEKTTTV